MKKRWLLLFPAVLVAVPLGWRVWVVNYTDYKASMVSGRVVATTSSSFEFLTG